MQRRRNMRRMLVSLFLLLAGPVCAQQMTANGPARPSPAVVMSIGQESVTGMFINWMHSCGSIGFNSGASPASLDANGYPNISAPGATISSACSLPTLAQYGGTWEIGWTGTGEIQVQGTSITNVTDPQSCVSGQIISGANCDVVFNFNSNPTITLQFNSGYTFTNMANGFLIRSTDKTAYLAGQVYTPEFLALAGQLQPLAWRTMGLTLSQLGTANNQSQWKYRTPVTAMSWENPVFFPNAWSSSITGTDEYTSSAASDTPTQWTYGESLDGVF